MTDLTIRIEAHDLPGLTCGPSPQRPEGHTGVHVAVQRRDRPDELLDPQPGDAERAAWTLDCKVTDDGDVRGRHIQGRRAGERFIYLNWGTVDEPGSFRMFRRAKLWLNTVPEDVMADALRSGTLVGRLGLTDAKGNPLCASVRPPVITWAAAPGHR
jgi:hypothetical protein